MSFFLNTGVLRGKVVVVENVGGISTKGRQDDLNKPQ